MDQPKLLIAVPAYGGAIKNGCVVSLIELCHALTRQGTAYTLEVRDIGGIDLARNYFAALLLRGSFSHLLFVDSDMTFSAETVLRLMEADKPIVGCIYPKKTAEPKFVVNAIGEKIAVTAEGLCRVSGIGMGLTLIQRKAFERLSNTDLRRFGGHQFNDVDGPLYGFFDCGTGANYRSEDIAFCDRWLATGGEIWALAGEDIGHVGDMTFRRNFLEFLKERAGK